MQPSPQAPQGLRYKTKGTQRQKNKRYLSLKGLRHSWKEYAFKPGRFCLYSEVFFRDCERRALLYPEQIISLANKTRQDNFLVDPVIKNHHHVFGSVAQLSMFIV